VNWQVKETTRSSLQSPRIDMKRLLTVVRRAGYHGYLPIETLRMGRTEYDTYTEIGKLLAELRDAIDATAAG
jgi:hypothetical protein